MSTAAPGVAGATGGIAPGRGGRRIAIAAALLVVAVSGAALTWAS